ncbi:MAG: hypothetical protein HY858_14560 [Candidatus Solibacter usitatus]|nr:hypothetical protein [Candidatus Solibacter usitatus]
MTTRELERQSVVRERALSIPEGAPVELRTSGRRKVSGALLAAEDEAVRLHHNAGGTYIESVWLFDEIDSIRRLDRPRFPRLGLAGRLLAIVLSLTLCLPAAELDLRAKALQIPTGAPILLKTTARQTLRGRLNAVSDAGIAMQLVENNAIAERTVPFSEIKSLKQTGKPMHPGYVVLLTLGVLWLFGIIIGTFVNS